MIPGGHRSENAGSVSPRSASSVSVGCICTDFGSIRSGIPLSSTVGSFSVVSLGRRAAQVSGSRGG
jgi:hypothetical protein